MYVAVALAVLLLATPVAWWRTRGGSPAPAGKSVSVLVSDFDNATGDPIFDNTLEPMFTLALEGAPFIAGYNRNQEPGGVRGGGPPPVTGSGSVRRHRR